MFRPVWYGSIRLAPMQIPVTAYTAVDARGARVRLAQLHAGCHEFVRQKKVCPIHGEIGADEIVMGFVHSNGSPVVLDHSELDELRPAIDASITIDRFVSPRTIDPIYFSGQSYYLAPTGSGPRSYRVLHQTMLDEDVCGLAPAVMPRTDHLVVVSPVDGLLAVSVLHYADAIRPAAMFEGEQEDSPVPAQQLAQARDLIRAMRIDDPGLEQYRDPYQARLAALIRTKSAGKDVGQRATDQLAGKVVNNLPSGQQQRTNRRLNSKLAGGERIRSQRPLPRRKSG